MADPRGFLKYQRESAPRRPTELRIRDWKEVYQEAPDNLLQEQSARCMDCGIPFCHQGCPLGNLIPEWNDLIYRQDLSEALDRLHATNNFPEFTGRLCPAPCEAACTLGIGDDPVSIEFIEKSIIELGYEHGLIRSVRPTSKSGKRVAVVGSGPAGLAAAQQLTRAGHEVEVFERSDKVGGLLRYGIPEFKMEKAVLDRRLCQMVDEGTKFHTNIEVGPDRSLIDLRREFDAVLLTIGSTIPRDMAIPGRELQGIYQAMEFLPMANRVALGELSDHPFSAKGKAVVIIGGGDTGADCLGTVHRQGAASVTQIEILPRPEDFRSSDNPWPTWPTIFRTSSAHEEGGMREFSINTESFVGDAVVSELRIHRVELHNVNGRMSFVKVDGSESAIPADLVLLAMGFVAPELDKIDPQGELGRDQRGNIATSETFMTNIEGVFSAGDGRRGQSLIVWAIAEGRSAASHIDRYLMGISDLPEPIAPSTRALVP